MNAQRPCNMRAATVQLACSYRGGHPLAYRCASCTLARTYTHVARGPRP
jgi:hypothetical protein